VVWVVLALVVFILNRFYISYLSALSTTFRLLIQLQSLHISTAPLGEAFSFSLYQLEKTISNPSPPQVVLIACTL